MPREESGQSVCASSRVERHKICPSGEDASVRVGVPKEIKTFENRVGLVPGSARELTHHGHDVLVETGAGAGSGFTDDAYRAAGTNAARMAMGMEAYVTVIDRSLPRLYELDLQFGSQLHTLYATVENIEREVVAADLVIGAVLIPGASAPKLVSREMVRAMRPGSVLVDIAIDQGGCFATSRPTTLAEPSYSEEGIIHYCVTNMPSAVARTSTLALNNATLPFVLALADKGWRQALAADAHLRPGLNVHAGRIIHPAVARDLNVEPGPAPV